MCSFLGSCLHNIYYRYISARNIKNGSPLQKHPKISLTIHLGDARAKISLLEGKYDHIYLDGFTPTKAPTLWSVEFFKKLFDLLDDNGNIVTYSKSAAIRVGMREAGFFVAKSARGTIAFKKKDLVTTPLDEISERLLDTKAGIPFYDKNLDSSAEEILERREKMMADSNKQNSSQFLKNYQNKK